METIVKRTGSVEREPVNVNILNMDVKLERSSDGVYVLVFTGTNEGGDGYCARVIPSNVEVWVDSEPETKGR